MIHEIKLVNCKDIPDMCLKMNSHLYFIPWGNSWCVEDIEESRFFQYLMNIDISRIRSLTDTLWKPRNKDELVDFSLTLDVEGYTDPVTYSLSIFDRGIFSEYMAIGSKIYASWDVTEGEDDLCGYAWPDFPDGLWDMLCSYTKTSSKNNIPFLLAYTPLGKSILETFQGLNKFPPDTKEILEKSGEIMSKIFSEGDKSYKVVYEQKNYGSPVKYYPDEYIFNSFTNTFVCNVVKNGSHIPTSMEGSGFKNLMNSIPILVAARMNKNFIGYVPYLSESLHPILEKVILDTFSEDKMEGQFITVLRSSSDKYVGEN